MKARRIRIDFQKIINGWYCEEDLLYIYRWLISIGRSCNKQHGWCRYGLHQSFHGYSYNNEKNEIHPLDSDCFKTIYDGFVRILCKTNLPDVVEAFLDENNIRIGKIRVIKFEENELENDYYKVSTGHRFGLPVEQLIYHITTAYKGLELKKEHFHPDYKDRIKPRIIDNVKIGTNHNKWYAWFTFSFEKFDYEPGWEWRISQNENEPISNFFNRAIEEIDGLLLPATSCDNCPLWRKSNNHGSYLRHGFRGGCSYYGKCDKPNVIEYKWETGGRDNALHDSIVFPYYKNR